MDVLPLSEKHLQGLAQLFEGYWKGRGLSLPRGWTERYLKEGHAVEIVGDQFFVAVQDGEVVGSMSLVFWEGRLAEMRDFVVKPEFRGQGVGERLYQAVAAECAQRRIRKVFAFVFPKVLAFFEERGFGKEGLLKDHFRKGEDLVVIGKFLD